MMSWHGLNRELGRLIRVFDPLSVLIFFLIPVTGGMSECIKGDEHILQAGGFVEEVLKICQERLERRIATSPWAMILAG